MTDLWPELAAQLAELDNMATAQLARGRDHPAPQGLPPNGSWIRAVTIDDDGRAKPMTPWHHVVGWDAPIGCLSIRCRRYPRGELPAALEVYLGGRPYVAPWRRGRGPERRLLVELAEPAEDRCRHCDNLREREALAILAEEQADAERSYLALRPKIAAMLADDGLDDAALGRRLRELWQDLPQPA